MAPRLQLHNTLKLRLESAHSAVVGAAVEAKRKIRLNGRNDSP